eukprot:gene19054-23717_t
MSQFEQAFDQPENELYVFSAWFTKKATGLKRSQERWFVLDIASMSIPYYTSENALLSELKGAIQLVQIKEASAFAGILTVVCNDRTWTLVARDPTDAEPWG